MSGCESWTVKKAEHQRIDAFWTVMLEKTLEGPLDYKELQPVHPKGDRSWIFIGRTDVEAETVILWPLDAKSWLIWKDLDAGQDWRQQEKGTTENEMVWWHHHLNGHKLGYTPGVGCGQEGRACCSLCSHAELDTTEQLNWTELNCAVVWTFFAIENNKIFLLIRSGWFDKRILGQYTPFHLTLIWVLNRGWQIRFRRHGEVSLGLHFLILDCTV